MKIDKSEIRRNVLTELARQGLARQVPVGISARHVHLTEADVTALFGEGYKLHPIKALSQPGQFAAREQVTVIGPRGRIERVRVLGPVRKESQIEISVSDSFVLGAKNCPVRLSGDLEGTPGVKLLGPEGQVELKKGLIVAARHLHMNDEQARAFGIHDKQIINIRVTGERPCILENVICRTGSAHTLELHLDTDEANSCSLGNEDLAEIVLPGSTNDSHVIPRKNSAVAQYDTCVRMENAVENMENADYVSGNIVSQGYAANWMKDRNQARYGDLKSQQGGVYAGSLNTDAMGQGNSLGISGYVSSNAGVLFGDGNRNVNPGVLANMQAASPHNPWREPTPAQRNAFLPIENGGQTASSSGEILDLVTEADINDAYRENRGQVYCEEKALITPLAKDRAVSAGIKIIRVKK